MYTNGHRLSPPSLCKHISTQTKYFDLQRHVVNYINCLSTEVCADPFNFGCHARWWPPEGTRQILQHQAPIATASAAAKEHAVSIANRHSPREANSCMQWYEHKRGPSPQAERTFSKTLQDLSASLSLTSSLCESQSVAVSNKTLTGIALTLEMWARCHTRFQIRP